MKKICLFHSLQQITSNYMKNSNKIVTTIKDFKLFLIPRSIIFLKKNPNSFRLYMEKGTPLQTSDMQVIGTVKQLVPPLAANKKYSFSQYNTPIQFRTVADKKSTYRIALYQLDATGIQQFVENSQLKFSKLMDEYFHEFLEIEKQLNIELKGKESLPINQIWKKLSNNFTQKAFFTSVKFDKIDAVLQLTIEPIHKYDELAKEAEILQQKKKQNRNRRILQGYNKTKTISDQVRHDWDSSLFKRGQTQNEHQPIKPFSFEQKKQSTNKDQIKQELKNFTINVKIKSKNDQTVLEQKKEQVKELESTAGFKSESKDGAERSQMIKTDKEEPQTIIETNKETEQTTIKPNTSVEHERYLVSPQRKYEIKKTGPSIQKIGATLGDSGTNKDKIWKQNIVLSFALFVSFGFGYLLMHPLSKV